MQLREIRNYIIDELDKFQYYDILLSKEFVRDLLEKIVVEMNNIDNPFELMWVELYFDLLKQDKEKNINVEDLIIKMRDMDRKYTMEVDPHEG